MTGFPTNAPTPSPSHNNFEMPVRQRSESAPTPSSQKTESPSGGIGRTWSYSKGSDGENGSIKDIANKNINNGGAQASSHSSNSQTGWSGTIKKPENPNPEIRKISQQRLVDNSGLGSAPMASGVRTGISARINPPPTTSVSSKSDLKNSSSNDSPLLSRRDSSQKLVRSEAKTDIWDLFPHSNSSPPSSPLAQPYPSPPLNPLGGGTSQTTHSTSSSPYPSPPLPQGSTSQTTSNKALPIVNNQTYPNLFKENPIIEIKENPIIEKPKSSPFGFKKIINNLIGSTDSPQVKKYERQEDSPTDHYIKGLSTMMGEFCYKLPEDSALTTILKYWQAGLDLSEADAKKSIDINKPEDMESLRELYQMKDNPVFIKAAQQDPMLDDLIKYLKFQLKTHTPNIIENTYGEAIKNAFKTQIEIPSTSKSNKINSFSSFLSKDGSGVSFKNNIIDLNKISDKYSTALTSNSIDLERDDQFSGDAALNVEIGGCRLIGVADASGHNDCSQKTPQVMLNKIQELVQSKISNNSVISKKDLRQLATQILEECSNISFEEGGVCTLSLQLIIPQPKTQSYKCVSMCIGDAGALELKNNNNQLSAKTMNPSVNPFKRASDNGGGIGHFYTGDFQFHFGVTEYKPGDMVVVGSDGIFDNLEGDVDYTRDEAFDEMTGKVDLGKTTKETLKASEKFISENGKSKDPKIQKQVEIKKKLICEFDNKYTEFRAANAIATGKDEQINAQTVGQKLMNFCAPASLAVTQRGKVGLSSTGAPRKPDDITLVVYQFPTF